MPRWAALRHRVPPRVQNLFALVLLLLLWSGVCPCLCKTLDTGTLGPSSPPGTLASLSLNSRPAPAEAPLGDNPALRLDDGSNDKLAQFEIPHDIDKNGTPMLHRRPWSEWVHKHEDSGSLLLAGLLMMPFDNRVDGALAPKGSGGAFGHWGSFLGTPTFLLPALGATYLLGQKDDKDTAKLALAALVNSAVVTQGVKMLTGRARPTAWEPEGEMTGPGPSSAGSSFPSGHTSAAFAVATVLAHKHPKQKWLYYGLATAVGLARIRTHEHFPSDVLVGAAVGIESGHRALQFGPRILGFKF